MPSILFVCTANQFRSPIAAACLSKFIESENTHRDWTVQSAGTWTKEGLSAPAVALQLAGQLGLSGLGRHRSRQISEKLLNDSDLIVVMEGGQKEAIRSEFPAVRDRLYLLSEIVDGIAYDIPDPFNSDINARDIGRELYTLIAISKEKILRLAESLSASKSPQRGNP